MCMCKKMCVGQIDSSVTTSEMGNVITTAPSTVRYIGQLKAACKATHAVNMYTENVTVSKLNFQTKQ